MSKIKYLASTLLLVVMGFMFVDCSESDSDSGGNSGLKGWYLDLSSVAKQSDFNEINKAIRNKEVLTSYKYNEYVASRDLFINSDGSYNDTDSHFGRLRFSIDFFINVVRILDDQTLVFYIGYLYEDGASNNEALYTFYAGSIFGNMTYYGTPTYYTYAKVGNKLIVSNGDIYTVTSDGLIKDGSSALWSKYDPKKREVVKPDDDEEEKDDSDTFTGTINGHEWIDLGLSVKWATCNVGASKPKDYGDYYAWGETTTKSDYSWKTYKWCKGTDDTMTKYCTDSDYGTVDNRTTLTSSDDVATVKWGSKWRMPTKEETRELCDECTWTWTTQNGVNGMKVTGPNGNSIFLPAAGYRSGTGLYSRGSYGYYWSATLYDYYSDDACHLYFYDGNRYRNSWAGRSVGFSVRPVTE